MPKTTRGEAAVDALTIRQNQVLGLLLRTSNPEQIKKIAAASKGQRFVRWPSIQYHVSFVVDANEISDTKYRWIINFWHLLNEWTLWLSLGEPRPFSISRDSYANAPLPDDSVVSTARSGYSSLRDQSTLKVDDKQGSEHGKYYAVGLRHRLNQGLYQPLAGDPTHAGALRVGFELRNLRFSYNVARYAVAMITAVLEHPYRPVRLSPPRPADCASGFAEPYLVVGSEGFSAQNIAMDPVYERPSFWKSYSRSLNQKSADFSQLFFQNQALSFVPLMHLNQSVTTRTNTPITPAYAESVKTYYAEFCAIVERLINNPDWPPAKWNYNTSEPELTDAKSPLARWYDQVEPVFFY